MQAAHFNNPNVALYGLGKFFKKAALEEQDHATQIIDYINKRGGQVKALKIDVSLSLRFFMELHNRMFQKEAESVIAHSDWFFCSHFYSLHPSRALQTCSNRSNTPSD